MTPTAVLTFAAIQAVMVLLGAWIAHTARQNRSPLPTLTKAKPAEPSAEPEKAQRKL